MDENIEKLSQEYDQKLYQSIAESAKEIVIALLNQNDVHFDQVTCRAKDIKKLREKIQRKGYTSLLQITDLAGVRVTVFYADQVQEVATLIRNHSEFEIDFLNSIEKSPTEDNQFDYRSSHLIASIKPAKDVPFVPPGVDKKIEIQVKSLLSHCWSENTHDSSYKAHTQLPEKIRRKIYSIAAILESADQEFIELRQQIEAFNREVESKANLSLDDISVDQQSIHIYLTGLNEVTKLENELCGHYARGISPKIRSYVYDQDLLDILRDNKLDTLKKLDDYALTFRTELKEDFENDVCVPSQSIFSDQSRDRGFLLPMIIRRIYLNKINQALGNSVKE